MSTPGQPTEKELAEIFMMFGRGADAIKALGITQEQFWRFAKRAAKKKGTRK